MKLERKLFIGIPRGSLNRDSRREPNRGDTRLLLREAGWELSGYYYKREKYYPKIKKGNKEVKFFVMRPREFPLLLNWGVLDLAICGRDTMEESYSSFWQDYHKEVYKDPQWRYITKLRKSMREKYSPLLKKFRNRHKDLVSAPWFRSYETWFIRRERDIERYGMLTLPLIHEDIQKMARSELKKGICGKVKYSGPRELCDLGYGKVDLYFATNKENKFLAGLLDFSFSEEANIESVINLTEELTCATEYPNIAYRELSKYFFPDLIEINWPQKGLSWIPTKPVEILFSHGTELFPLSKMMYVILECVASGKSLKEGKLETLGESILTSTARLYTTSRAVIHPAYCTEHNPLIGENLYSGWGYARRLNKLATKNGDAKWREDKIVEVSERLQDASKRLGWLR